MAGGSTRELAAADVEIVRPLHADGSPGECVERFSREEPAAKGHHLERDGIIRALHEREPDPCSARRSPRASVPAAPRRLLVGEDHPSANPSYTHKYAYRGLVPMDKAIEAIGEELASNACMHVCVPPDRSQLYGVY